MNVLIAILMFVFSGFSCETFGASDYQGLLTNLLAGKTKEADSLLRKNHCGDSIAWRYATSLVEQAADPIQIFDQALDESESGRNRGSIEYASIPVIFVQMRKPINWMYDLRQMYVLLDSSKQSVRQKKLIEMQLDVSWAVLVESSKNDSILNVKRKNKQ